MLAQPRTQQGPSHARIDAETAERAADPSWMKNVFGTLVYGDNPENRETIRSVGTDRGTVCFEAEVVHPKSGQYRAVYVHVPAEQVLALLKMCRHAAAAQREQAMS